ncbi:MAG: ATP-binding cassette domain-containing protein, partial [Acidobacteria bacterium]|nr:ATP-binding cassette domain-containing protein [Acidobacteriota bacterium]
MAGVEFIGAGKMYVNGTQAVHPSDLAIDDGESNGARGLIGCDKTTLLRMLARLEVVTEGEIRLGDRQLNDVYPRDRDITVVLQNCALYLHMTVTANIGFPLR